MARNEAVDTRTCSECGTPLKRTQKVACSRRCVNRRYTQAHMLEKRDRLRAWRAANPDKARDQEERRRILSPEAVSTSQRGWRQRNRARVKAYWRAHRLRRYGVTEEWFREQLVGQAGRCGICGDVMAPGPGTHIDHDHRSGRVRGLLCSNCNTALGLMGDSPRILLAAVRYLEVPDGS